MTNHFISKNHVSAQVAPLLRQRVMDKKHESPIRYFDFQRFYGTGEMAYLSSNISFMNDRVNIQAPFVEPNLVEGTFVANEIFHSEELSLDENHDLHSGICMVQKCGNITDVFYFASDQENKRCISYYLNNIHYLQDYIRQFKADFYQAIKQADHEKIDIPQHLIQRELSADINLPFTQGSSATDILSLLSNQEKTVLSLTLRGKTQQEMASLMNVSRSSVCTYLDRVMVKLNCETRSELIEYAWQSRLISLNVMN